ncbi:MAG: GNAT family N-acetyltransferase, partial [Muribaculaceae bacterium]|nr:GNAT family N-acetyltransferase [Muribaculaceae bacterium]
MLFRGFENAFSDYEIHFDKEEVRSMLERRGYNPELSFAAFEKGEIVAFTLNGIGLFNGVPTAYDTGTGTVKAYRGQGLAGNIFSRSVPLLKEAGIRQYLLEVLQNNESAISVYRRMHFKKTREFDCFRQSITNIRNLDTACIGCRIEQTDIESIRQAQSFCDFCPSLQNGIESIERGKSGLTFLCAFQSVQTAGYC